MCGIGVLHASEISVHDLYNRNINPVTITVFMAKVNLICGMLCLMLRNEFSDFMEFCIISRLARLHHIQCLHS